MSTLPIVSGVRMLRTADWLFDHELEAQDNAACEQYDRRVAIEDAVTFADLLEEMADFTGPRAEAFMQAYRQYTRGMPTLYALIDQAFERIVTRRLAHGD